MFVHLIEFEVVAEKEPQWEPYMRNFHAVEARMPGGVLFRVLRRLDDPHKYISVRTWRSKGQSKAASGAQEIALAGRPSREEGHYQGKAMTWTRCELLDFAWGIQGPAGYNHRDLFVRYSVRDIAPERFKAHRAFSRNFISVMARQKGVASVEVVRPLAQPHRVVSLLTFRGKEHWPLDPQAEPSAEVQLAFEAGRHTRVYEGASAPLSLSCAVFDAAWGTDGPAAYQEFMETLAPVF